MDPILNTAVYNNIITQILTVQLIAIAIIITIIIKEMGTITIVIKQHKVMW